MISIVYQCVVSNGVTTVVDYTGDLYLVISHLSIREALEPLKVIIVNN